MIKLTTEIYIQGIPKKKIQKKMETLEKTLDKHYRVSMKKIQAGENYRLSEADEEKVSEMTTELDDILTVEAERALEQGKELLIEQLKETIREDIKKSILSTKEKQHD